MRSRRAWRSLAALAAVAPWTWFLVRDVDARLDAVSLGWPIIGAVTVVGLTLAAALARRWELGLAAVSWLAASAVLVVAPWAPAGGPGPAPATDVRVVAANVLAPRRMDVLADLVDQDPELLVVSELATALDAELRGRFRYAERSPVLGPSHGDVGVYSDLPLRQTPLPPALRSQRGLRALVATAGGDVVLYALHLDRPSVQPEGGSQLGFRSQRRLVEALRDAVAGEDRPVLVVGDLNLSDRTSGYRALTRVLDDAARAGWVGPTSLKRSTRPLLARVDHVLVDPDWCATDGGTFELTGSDHRGVATTVGPCP